MKDYLNKELRKLCSKYLPENIRNSTHYDRVITEWCKFLDENPIQNTEYFDPANYYASPIKVDEVEVWDCEVAMEFVAEWLDLHSHEFECMSTRKLLVIPESLKDFVSTDKEELLVDTLRAFPVTLLCAHNDSTLLIDEEELTANNPLIMSLDDWDKVYDHIMDRESDLVMNETVNQYYNTSANILNAILEELQELIDEETVEEQV